MKLAFLLLVLVMTLVLNILTSFFGWENSENFFYSNVVFSNNFVDDER